MQLMSAGVVEGDIIVRTAMARISLRGMDEGLIILPDVVELCNNNFFP